MSFPAAAAAFSIATVVAFGMSFLVLRHGIRETSSRSLAAFLFLFGILLGARGVGAMGFGDEVGARLGAGASLAGSLVWYAALAFALTWPTPVSWLPKWAKSLTLFLAIGTSLHYLENYLVNHYPEPPWSPWLLVVGTLLYLLATAISLLAIAVLTWRGIIQSNKAARAGPFMVAGTLSLFWVYNFFRDVWRTNWPLESFEAYWDYLRFVLNAVIHPLVMLTIVAIILVKARMRRLTILIVAVAAAGAIDDLLRVIGDKYDAHELLLQVRYLMWASAYLTVALVLAFLVLRGHMPGITAKFRFGISRSAIAAFFVAAFFIGSEAAQSFFGDTLQNEYFGIAAAGGLVFAFAPLSRLADRIATKAVPGQDDTTGSYRILLENVYADGKVSVDEERALARAAKGMGIDPETALDLRLEVQAAKE